MNLLVRFALGAMLPPAHGLPGAAELDLDAFVVRFRRDTSATMWLGTVASAIVFVCLPVFTIGVPLPAFLLPAAWRDRHADRMAEHPLYLVRSAALMLKLVVGLQWAAHPRIREAFGLPPYPDDPDTWRTA